MRNPQDRSTSDGDFGEGDLPEMVGLFKEIPRFLRWNNVEYFEVQGITITFHDPAGSTSTIRAGKMSPLPRGQLFLEGGVVLTDEGSGRQLTTGQVVWWPNLGVYAVSGTYSLRRPGRIQRARHTLFDAKLEPITNEKEITRYEQRASAASFPGNTE